MTITDLNASPQRGSSGTRARELTAALESMILNGELKPGDRLDETRLAQRFHVSRTPVREALKQLSASGLVQTKPRQGAVVARLTVPDLIYMFELMAVLEGACAGFAARRHTVADRSAIAAAHEACCEATRQEDPAGFYRANIEFHNAIYAASHNTLLREQTTTLRRRLEPYRRHITFHPGRMARTNGEHARIMAAIFEMNEETADKLMRTHLDKLSDDVASLIATAYGDHAAE